MISRTFDSTDNEKNEEGIGNENQQIMEIDTSGNTEDIPSDPSSQPQKAIHHKKTILVKSPSITRRPFYRVLIILWISERYDGSNKAASRVV